MPKICDFISLAKLFIFEKLKKQFDYIENYIDSILKSKNRVTSFSV